MLVWPTSEFPIWPSGRPTSMPEAPIWVRGFSEKSLSRFGVLAALMALPSAGAKPKPSIIISIKGFFIGQCLLFVGIPRLPGALDRSPPAQEAKCFWPALSVRARAGQAWARRPKERKCFVSALTLLTCTAEVPFIPKERPPPIPFQTYLEAAFTIAAKSGAFKAAPPMRPPSTSGWATSSSAFLAFMEPPY